MKWGNFTTEQKEGESWEEIREVWERGGEIKNLFQEQKVSYLDAVYDDHLRLCLFLLVKKLAFMTYSFLYFPFVSLLSSTSSSFATFDQQHHRC